MPTRTMPGASAVASREGGGSRHRGGPAGRPRRPARGPARAADVQQREPRVRLAVHVHARPRLSRRGGAERPQEGGQARRGGRARAAAPAIAPAAAASAHRGSPRVRNEPRGSGSGARVRRPARRVEIRRVQGSGFRLLFSRSPRLTTEFSDRESAAARPKSDELMTNRGDSETVIPTFEGEDSTRSLQPGHRPPLSEPRRTPPRTTAHARFHAARARVVRTRASFVTPGTEPSRANRIPPIA